jgi:hypothetical protein
MDVSLLSEAFRNIAANSRTGRLLSLSRFIFRSRFKNDNDWKDGEARSLLPNPDFIADLKLLSLSLEVVVYREDAEKRLSPLAGGGWTPGGSFGSVQPTDFIKLSAH